MNIHDLISAIEREAYQQRTGDHQAAVDQYLMDCGEPGLSDTHYRINAHRSLAADAEKERRNRTHRPQPSNIEWDYQMFFYLAPCQAWGQYSRLPVAA